VSTEFESTDPSLTGGCVNSSRERLMVSRELNSSRERLMVSREHSMDLMDTVVSRKAALVVLCANTD